MAMRRSSRELIIVIVVSLLAFAIATTIVNVRSNQRIRKEVAIEVTKTNRALCDIFRFSAAPRPRPPQPKTEPTSEFGKQLAEYNRQQATSQAKGRELIEAAIKRYRC